MDQQPWRSVVAGCYAMQLDAVDCGAVMGRAIQGLTLGDDFHWSFRADPGLIDK
jgi:hypothetical protein